MEWMMDAKVISIQDGHADPVSAAAPYQRGGWSAVFALTRCVSTLIASEFMPFIASAALLAASALLAVFDARRASSDFPSQPKDI